MKNWTLKIDISVSDNWIKDGANPSEWTEKIQELIESNFLGYTILLYPLQEIAFRNCSYAYPNEFKVGVTVSKEPTLKEIEDIIKR